MVSALHDVERRRAAERREVLAEQVEVAERSSVPSRNRHGTVIDGQWPTRSDSGLPGGCRG